MKLNKTKYTKFILFCLFSGIIFLATSESCNILAGEPSPSATSTNTNRLYSIRLDQETIAKGYTVTAFGLKLSLVPGILSEATGVEVIEINEDMPEPWKLDKISSVYQFEFKNKTAYDEHKPFYIQFNYSNFNNFYKQVYFFDKNFNKWRPLPTRDLPKEKIVRSLIHLSFARIAIFSDPAILTSGTASWYAYKGGDYAASPDFPKGSRLRVYNSENGKYVDVEINDYGPDRSIFPNRIVDLDKAAFYKIGSLSDGVINTRVEPMAIPADNFGRILGISPKGIGTEPEISVKAAIIKNELSGKIYYSKAATTSLPLASLTKLVAIKVFLDTRPSLNNIVTYKYQDEEYNYEYCKKWESSKLKIEEGESLSIEDLLYSSLVGSTNNTIETLVRVSGMNRGEFIELMNRTVANWGASKTHFIEPTGLSPDNVTSAADYAIIIKEVYKNPLIQKASTIKEYTFYTDNTEEFHRIKNTNKLINTNLYSITGSKTGYLDEAGYCLALRAKVINNQELIVVTFGAKDRETSFYETQELLNYGIRKIRK